MGLTKSQSFTDEQNAVATLAKAIGHPARVAILQHLIEKDACICGELVDVLPLSQATVSQHLRELKNVGLVKGNIQGTSICYCLNTEQWDEAFKTFNLLLDPIKRVTKCC